MQATGWRRILGVTMILGLTFAACSGGTATTAPSAPASESAANSPAWCKDGVVTIGTEFPMSGASAANGEPAVNGVRLAIKEQNAKGGIAGCKLDINVQDDAVNGIHDVQQGAKNMATLVADTSVIGVMGPYNSSVAKAQIPISNEAGLLQCSPANTAVSLTEGPDAIKLREAQPDKLNYIRTATKDSVQGPAGADFIFKDLNAKSVYLLDDTQLFGVGLADAFAAEFTALGGTVVKHDSAPISTSDFTALFTGAAALKPAAVYFAGNLATGMGLAMAQARTVPGMENIPFMGPDATTDLLQGGVPGAAITIVGSAAHDLYGTLSSAHDIPGAKAFHDAYAAEFSGTPENSYSASAYACAQVIMQSLEKAAATATDLASARESVRANATNTANTFDTLIDKRLAFDKNGDNIAPYISYYKTDMTAAGGKGDWVFIKQEAFPAKR